MPEDRHGEALGFCPRVSSVHLPKVTPTWAPHARATFSNATVCFTTRSTDSFVADFAGYHQYKSPPLPQSPITDLDSDFQLYKNASSASSWRRAVMTRPDPAISKVEGRVDRLTWKLTFFSSTSCGSSSPESESGIAQVHGEGDVGSRQSRGGDEMVVTTNRHELLKAR